jgi:hypothetical protein
LEALVDELQVLEDTICQLQDARTLQGSYGWWLDRIGEELKVSRGNYNDADYKTAIKIAMAKKTASASKQDIERIAFLLTGDDTVRLENPYPYMLELVGYLFCIADSPEGLEALADLFPVNTRVRLIKKDIKSFKFGTVGQGFGSGAKLNDLRYYKYGNTFDSRFTTLANPIPPTPTEFAPMNVVAPTILGGNQQGDMLSVDVGQWSGDTPITYTQQWLREGVDIIGATNTTYIITSGDVGATLSCRVTATNDVGSASALSNSVSVSVIIPPTTVLTSNLGLASGVGTENIDFSGEIVSAEYTIEINSDGSVLRTRSTPSGLVVENDKWLETIAASAGDDYTITYTVNSGYTPVSLNPNVVHSLSSKRIISLLLNDNAGVLASNLTITIRNVTDSSIFRTVSIFMSAELIDLS